MAGYAPSARDSHLRSMNQMDQPEQRSFRQRLRARRRARTAAQNGGGARIRCFSLGQDCRMSRGG